MISDGTDGYPCKQKVTACLSHDFFDPDVSAQALTGFDCMGGGEMTR